MNIDYKINKKFILQNAGDQILVFDSEKSILYTLNSTATLVLKGLKKSLRIREIAKQISQKFDIEESLALNDVSVCIEDLAKKKIITL